MAAKITELRGRATEIARHPRTRKIAIWLVAIFAFDRRRGAGRAAAIERQDRERSFLPNSTGQVSIEQIRFNPFTMSADRSWLSHEGTPRSATALSFDEFYANLELRSLFRWAPVLKKSDWSNPMSTWSETKTAPITSPT